MNKLPSYRNKDNIREYVPLDEQDTPAIWRLIILALLGFLFFSSVWVFSEYPGTVVINGESEWSSNQTWYAAFHFGSLIVAALLTALKR